MYFKCSFKFCFGSINMSKNEHLYVKIEISLCFKAVIKLYKWLLFFHYFIYSLRLGGECNEYNWNWSKIVLYAQLSWIETDDFDFDGPAGSGRGMEIQARRGKVTLILF